MTATSAPAPEQPEARQLLVELLRQAARLEHCLLDAYLFAACSIRSTPQEFALAGSAENRRRAIQFERARGWKQALLGVAHEEMLHLHYVQCMLRALGEAPCLDLPERAGDGSWAIEGWKASVGGVEVDGGTGVHVPVAPLTVGTLRRFVLYEASDSLQDADPSGPAVSALCDRLADLELELHVESSLLHVDDAARRQSMSDALRSLYVRLTPLEQAVAAPEGVVAGGPQPLPPVEALRFQSIADLYRRGILPLFEQAFDLGWVAHANVDLNDELLDPAHAAEGLLPVGPVYRDKNFEPFSAANRDDPLRHYKDVAEMIEEIVEEGEGLPRFEARAAALLDKVAGLGGPRQYLAAVLGDRASPDPTPPWLHEGQLLRGSHLYRFAVALTELGREVDLAAASGLPFEPARSPLPVPASPGLHRLCDELPAQFNACYLVMLALLSRIYELRGWAADTPRRAAIEMLASWPLMSLAVRPFLELASFFPVEPARLFRLEADALPLLPLHAQELQRLYTAPERTQAGNEHMDYLAVRVLADVAAWAREQTDAVGGADLPDHERRMVLGRLAQLSQLDEFQRQFPFRVHGGYSNRLPDLSYVQEQQGADRYAEDPTTMESPFEDTLVLRLRFAGWGLVQLATDPDPPLDEAGCSGTLMLHAADGDRRLDRSLVWQHDDPAATILRPPRPPLPPLGVHCVDITLLVAGDGVAAGYVPLPVKQAGGPATGAGVDRTLEIDGLETVVTIPAAEVAGPRRRLRVHLLEKDGRKPFLNGANHLVWQDGEPIDPFVLAVSAGGTGGTPEPFLQREVFNEGLDLLAMAPLQRLYSARQPCGFDGDLSHIPSWAIPALSDPVRRLVQAPGYPRTYLAARARALAEALAEALDEGDPDQAGDSRERVDAVISLAERMALVSVPRGTTVGWLRIMLHYGHTVSGPAGAAAVADPVLAALSARTRLDLRPAADSPRDAPNGRWLVKYTKGLMDTDALSDFVFGEVYVPLAAAVGQEPVQLHFAWRFPATMAGAVAAFACRFERPFWAQYEVHGDSRRRLLGNGTVLTEVLDDGATADSYAYTAPATAGVSSYEAVFAVKSDGGDQVTLSWDVRLHCADASAAVAAVGQAASSAREMTAAMHDHFGPRA